MTILINGGILCCFHGIGGISSLYPAILINARTLRNDPQRRIMIEVTDVTKAFTAKIGSAGSGKSKLKVKSGEFILILGRSGSGKSTLLGMLAGLIRRHRGV